MIPGIKGELDGVPFGGGQIFGIEDQSALANGNLVLGSKGKGQQDEREENGGGMHGE